MPEGRQHNNDKEVAAKLVDSYPRRTCAGMTQRILCLHCAIDLIGLLLARIMVLGPLH